MALLITTIVLSLLIGGGLCYAEPRVKHPGAQFDLWLGCVLLLVLVGVCL